MESLHDLNEIQVKAKLLGLHRIMKDKMDYDFDDVMDLIEIAQTVISVQANEISKRDIEIEQLKTTINKLKQ